MKAIPAKTKIVTRKDKPASIIGAGNGSQRMILLEFVRSSTRHNRPHDG